MKSIRNLIIEDLKIIVKKLTGQEISPSVQRTNNDKFGDYFSNIAMQAFRLIPSGAGSTLEMAKKIKDDLKSSYIEKVEIAEPGFINFFIKSEIWQKEIESSVKKESFESEFSHQKIIVEYTDPNPFKEFHVGHLYSNSIGESICRLLEACGADVKRANYQGDVGLHVAKCVWGMKKAFQGAHKLPDITKKPLDARIDFLGSAYAEGAEKYETDSKAKEEISELNKEIYDKQDEIEEYKLGKAWSLENFEAIYKRLGTKFDLYYFESEVGSEGADMVGRNLQKGIFEKSQGAIIFPGEKFGLHSRVFVTSRGLPTYEAKELGLAFRKYKDFAYDESIIVTGSEIIEYFKILIKAIAQIDPKLAAKTRHIAHGMVRMPGGKISSRLGNVISATWLLDEAKKRALKISGEKKAASHQVNSEQVAEQMAVGAVKYAFLKSNSAQDIKFSFEEAMTLEGNSAPYLQYTHARCRSVLEKGGQVKVSTNLFFEPFVSTQDKLGEKSKSSSRLAASNNINKEEIQLLHMLGHFEEAVVDSAENFSPNTLANYLFEVAQKYNNFYNNLRIIDSKEPQRSRRLFVTEATAEILSRGLYLLGISAPQRM